MGKFVFRLFEFIGNSSEEVILLVEPPIVSFDKDINPTDMEISITQSVTKGQQGSVDVDVGFRQATQPLFNYF